MEGGYRSLDDVLALLTLGWKLELMDDIGGSFLEKSRSLFTINVSC